MGGLRVAASIGGRAIPPRPPASIGGLAIGIHRCSATKVGSYLMRCSPLVGRFTFMALDYAILLQVFYKNDLHKGDAFWQLRGQLSPYGHPAV